GSRTAASTTWYFRILEAAALKHGFRTDVPVRDLSAKDLKLILYGDPSPVTVIYRGHSGHQNKWETKFEGVIANMTRRYKETDSDHMRQEFERYMASVPCPTCKGARLKPETLAVKVGEKNIAQTTALSIIEAQAWFDYLGGKNTPFTEREQTIAYQILK